MFKRLKVWMYLAALTGGCMLGSGCLGISNDIDSVGRVLLAILREDLFG
jgi:hypothetical protein